jgi:hypothetical protein
MQEGDLVRLTKLFIPSSESVRGYRYGIVTGILRRDDGDSSSEIIEILVQLCEGDRTLFYTDQWGLHPTYSFYPHEVEPVE